MYSFQCMPITRKWRPRPWLFSLTVFNVIGPLSVDPFFLLMHQQVPTRMLASCPQKKCFFADFHKTLENIPQIYLMYGKILLKAGSKQC
jgi:hypothetical protein